MPSSGSSPGPRISRPSARWSSRSCSTTASANASEAADRLYLHRNSMLYRLARITELTGLDLKDPRVRLALELGLLVLDKGDGEDEDEHP
jgi:hypothetical protein